MSWMARGKGVNDRGLMCGRGNNWTTARFVCVTQIRAKVRCQGGKSPCVDVWTGGAAVDVGGTGTGRDVLGLKSGSVQMSAADVLVQKSDRRAYDGPGRCLCF